MTDIASKFNGTLFVADLAMNGRVLEEDGTVETAIIISLFTDRRADPDDELPFGVTDRRGWWGDAISPQAAQASGAHRIGSRLWLLKREKQTQETLNRARQYIEEALTWMTEDRVFTRVEVTTEWVQPGMLGFLVIGDFADGSDYRKRFVMQLQGN